MKYSLCAAQSSISIPRTDQPNSAEIDIAVAQNDVCAFPQSFDAVQLRIRNFDMIGIPQRRAAQWRQFAMADCQAMIVPEGIAQVEIAIFHLHIRALFESAFSIGWPVEGAVLYKNPFAAI